MALNITVEPSVHTMPNKVEGQEQDTSSISKVFKPIINLMRLFGLCTDMISDDHRQDYCISKIPLVSKVYGCIVVLAFAGNSIRIFPELKSTEGFTFYLRISISFWFLRCFLQAAYIEFICWRIKKSKSRLVKLISSIEEVASKTGLEEIGLKTFRRKTTILYVMTSAIMFANASFVVVGLFAKQLGVYRILENMSLTGNLPGRVCYSLMHVYLSIAWMVATLLYCLICQALVLVLGLLENNVNHITNERPLRYQLAEIRSMYLKVTDLVEQADNLFGPLVFLVYFFDIIQFSFNLYVTFYSAKTTIEKFLSAFWVGVSLMNLLFLSFCASSVIDKGKDVAGFLQKLDTSTADEKSNAELSLLIFHLTGDPVVMTIWKLIPLYKSIIVSVFISLITYFTLLLQFK